MRLSLALVAGAAFLAGLAGCSSTSVTTERHTYGPTFHGRSDLRMQLAMALERYQARHQVEAPRCELTDADVERALRANERLTAERREAAALVVNAARGQAPDRVAVAVRTCYALGAREAGHALIGASLGVFEFADAEPLVAVDCHYRTTGTSGWMEVRVTRRPGVEGPLAIAFPPGTYGIADWTKPDDDDRYGRWPSAQDLGFLRAPVIELREDEDEAVERVEVACASFRKGPPRADQSFTLARFPAGSVEDALALELCAGAMKPEADAQLALWMARNDITWNEFVHEGGSWGRLVTFGSHQRIGAENAAGAAQLLLGSGSHPASARFFGGGGARRIEWTGDAASSSSEEGIPAAEPIPAATPGAVP